jgi:hypothetical protein
MEIGNEGLQKAETEDMYTNNELEAPREAQALP